MDLMLLLSFSFEINWWVAREFRGKVEGYSAHNLHFEERARSGGGGGL